MAHNRHQQCLRTGNEDYDDYSDNVSLKDPTYFNAHQNMKARKPHETEICCNNKRIFVNRNHRAVNSNIYAVKRKQIIHDDIDYSSEEDNYKERYEPTEYIYELPNVSRKHKCRQWAKEQMCPRVNLYGFYNPDEISVTDNEYIDYEKINHSVIQRHYNANKFKVYNKDQDLYGTYSRDRSISPNKKQRKERRNENNIYDTENVKSVKTFKGSKSYSLRNKWKEPGPYSNDNVDAYCQMCGHFSKLGANETKNIYGSRQVHFKQHSAGYCTICMTNNRNVYSNPIMDNNDSFLNKQSEVLRIVDSRDNVLSPSRLKLDLDTNRLYRSSGIRNDPEIEEIKAYHPYKTLCKENIYNNVEKNKNYFACSNTNADEIVVNYVYKNKPDYLEQRSSDLTTLEDTGESKVKSNQILHIRKGDIEIVNPTVITKISMDENKNGLQSNYDTVVKSELTTKSSNKNQVYKRTGMDWNQYHRLEVIHNFLNELEYDYPAICTVGVIGNSREGRALKILKISNSNANNSGVWLDAGIHGREWIAPAVATYVANSIVKNFNSMPEYITNKDWYILPVMNPDGYEYSHTDDRMWRKNRAWHRGQCVGVDLNRNFSFGWGGKGSSETPTHAFFRGPRPFSEPESSAVRDIISNAGISFKVYITLHSFGQVIIFPFAYREELCPNYIRLLEGATVMSRAIFGSSGNIYKVGISKDVMYNASGTSNDWSYGEAKIPYCYLIELRSKKHKFKVPKEEIEETGEEILNCVKALMEFVDKYPLEKN